MAHIPPNLLICRSCKREWLHLGEQACPTCASRDIDIRCGRQKSGGRGPCRKTRVKGRHRCDMHGGKQKRGVEHHAFVHGEYAGDSFARLLPERYRETYANELNRPDYHRLDRDLAALWSRVAELAEAADGGAPEHWQEAAKLWAAVRGGDADAPARLDALLLAGAASADAWKEIREIAESRARISRADAESAAKLGEVTRDATVSALMVGLVGQLRGLIPPNEHPKAERIVADFVARLGAAK